MTSRNIKIIILIVIAVVMGGGGFMIGKKLKQNIKEQSQTSKTEQEVKDSAPSKVDTKVYESAYEVFHPDHGPIIETLDITVTYKGEQALTSLKKSQQQDIKIDQEVILYDKEGYVLPLGGHVSDISNDNITITLPKGTNTEYLNQKLSIIINQVNHAKRLPLDIIQQDTDQKTYVWVATPYQQVEETVYIAEKYYIDLNTAFHSDNFVQISHKISVQDFIVLNPDSKITTDRLYKMSFVDLKRPTKHPIKQAWLNYTAHIREQDNKKLEEAAHNCDQATEQEQSYDTTISNTSQSAACGSSNTNYSKDPIEIFNDLIKTR